MPSLLPRRGGPTELVESPEVENLILANHVEAVNGLLYISGGGWTDHWRPQPPPGSPPIFSHLAVAVTVMVPAAAPPVPQQLAVSVEDDQGRQVAGMQTQINQARPPGLPVGQAQRIALALTFNLVFPVAGDYRIVARLGISTPRELPFRVHDVAPPEVSAPPLN
ncbi:MAG TPA: hypothetical protein VNF75_01910 [Candidatus Dormibacteraeota bacterium]|nr:hypothetical protein [Candidatus Dormibacteraeota bacterium]